MPATTVTRAEKGNAIFCSAVTRLRIEDTETVPSPY